MNERGCRVWRGATAKGGYGKRKIKGRMVLVHRWTWEQVNGPIPDGMKVLHQCDNPPCYLIEHLFLGTQADNMADMHAKGRARHGVGRPLGEANGMSKLTVTQVAEVREAIAQGDVQRRIAERYGVSPATISKIKTGVVWRDS